MSTVTVTPTFEPSAGPSDPPRVRLEITDSGTPAVTSTTVVRLDPDGRTVPVRTDDGGPLALSGAAGLLYDYEAPFGVAVTYSTEESPTVVSSAVTVDEPLVWLIHPGVPEISTPITVARFSARNRAVQRAVFRPIGRKNAVVHTDGQRKSAEYTLSLLTLSDEERQRIDNVCDDASVLLLNVPAGKGWGITAEYVSVGDIAEDRVTRFAGEPMRTWELPVIVVDRPVGGSQAERTWADVVVDNATWADVTARYSTWLDLLAGP